MTESGRSDGPRVAVLNVVLFMYINLPQLKLLHGLNLERILMEEQATQPFGESL